MAMGDTGISKIWMFFKETYVSQPPPNNGLSAFKKDWDKLTDADKDQIRGGITSGTLTY